MTILYIHNDPALMPRLTSRRRARGDRPRAQARFSFAAVPTERIYDENQPEFAFWQCREAALLTLDAWAKLDGPLARWHNGATTLALKHNRGEGLKAHYDRSELSFFRWDTGARSFFTATSADAVAHVVGHAILDTLRPGLWNSLYPEVAAFHEGFADCVALLVSLFDRKIRERLLRDASSPARALGSSNVLERIAESVADEIRGEFGARHPASQPRRARNDFQWDIPTNFHPVASPGFISREPHSFGQIFVGCFYDLIDDLFRASPDRDAAALFRAATTAGRLLAQAVRTAPEDLRFFRAIGRAMVLADHAQNNGENRAAIGRAFAGHNIALGSSALLAPSMTLNGPPPRAAGGAVRRLNTSTRRDLCRRVATPPKTRIHMEEVGLGPEVVSKAEYVREVSLGKLGKNLKGIVGRATESVLLGGGKRCVVLGQLPNAQATEDEVLAFVDELRKDGMLAVGSAKGVAKGGLTHGVRTTRGKKVLTRIRYSCAAGSRSTT